MLAVCLVRWHALDDSSADIVEPGRAGVGLANKAKAVQLSVLRKYGVLADFSGLDEVGLDRALKGRVSASVSMDLTFANWCDQLLGLGQRVPVARFDHQVAGQIRLDKLVVGQDLAASLKVHDRQLQARLKASEQEVMRLQDQLQALRQTRDHAALMEPESVAAQRLKSWYHDTTDPLHNILWEIKEIDGRIFDHQGHINRDYRQQLVEIILRALNGLARFGLYVEAELRDASPKEPVLPSVMLHHNPPDRGEEHLLEHFDFVVKGVQPDVLRAASEFLFLGQALPEMDKQHRFDCHVKVSYRDGLELDREELFHLSCFLQKLFEALARSNDGRPRGALRETVILCLLLSWTAPCMPMRIQRAQVLSLQDTFYRGHKPFTTDTSNPDRDVSAGKIIEHLFHTLHALVMR